MSDIFKDLIKRLEDVKNLKEVAVPIKVDEDGYVEKECPNEICQFQFKVLEKDWIDIFEDEAVYCPRCGETSTSDSFWTTEQIEKAKKQAIKLVRDRLNGKPFPRSIIPITASRPFELQLKCDGCQANYSVQGSGFYCPSCGSNSIEKNYEATLSKIKAKLQSAESIRDLLFEAGHVEESKIIKQAIYRECLTDCSVAFQMISSYLYEKASGNKESPNSFQNLERGSKLWNKLLNISYADILSQEDTNFLFLQFQRRHLIQHCGSIVDKDYVKKTKDSQYKIGQEIKVTVSDVELTLELTTGLVEYIRKSS
jgi:Zn finger protein HypA/HybF involved in hydrogenase expression